MSQTTSVPWQSGQQYVFPNITPPQISLQSYTKDLRSETEKGRLWLMCFDGENSVMLSAFVVGYRCFLFGFQGVLLRFQASLSPPQQS
jgi:hypothetical protein